jgi:hypothetical protein
MVGIRIAWGAGFGPSLRESLFGNEIAAGNPDFPSGLKRDERNSGKENNEQL